MRARPVITTAILPGLDAFQAARLRRDFRQHVRVGETDHVIDLSGLTTLAAPALGVLIAALRAMRQTSGRTVLVASDPGVLSALRATALDFFFPIHPTASSALASFERSDLRSPGSLRRALNVLGIR